MHPFSKFAIAVAPLAIFTSSYALSQEAQTPQTLQEVKVVGEKADTEELFIKTDESTADRMGRTVKETPQSVSIISQKQFEMQGARSIQDSVRYAAGVNAEPYGTDTRGDYVSIRGAEVGQFRDGLQTIFSANTTQARPSLWGAERVEVLRGPSSLAYGQTSATGLVNLVTKKPQTERKGEVQFELGSYDRHQTSLDLTGGINDSKVWSYRLLSQIRNAETQVKHTQDDSVYIAPSIRYQPSKDTDVIVQLDYQRDDGTPSSQFHPIQGSLQDTPTGKLDMRTNLGEPGFDEQIGKTSSATILWNQNISDAWSYHQTIRFTKMEASYQQIYKGWGANPDPVTGDIARSSWINHNKTDALALDAHVNGKFDLGGTKTNVMIGVDHQNAKVDSATGFGVASSINAYNPVYGNYTAPTLTDVPEYKQSQTGIYAQADAKFFDALTVIAGVRQDKAKNEGTAYDKVDTDATTSKGALVYDVIPEVATYLSYSESFTPNTGLDENNKSFDPRKGEQIEVGVKYQLPRTLATLAYYNLKEKDRLGTSPTNPNFSKPIGEVEIKGAELEVLVDLAEGLSGNFAYSVLDSEITKDAVGGNEGKRLAAAPEKMANLFVNYKFLGDTLRGFGIGGGVRYVGESWDGADITKTPERTLYDAVLSYARDQWEFTATGNNLGDKTYFTACRTFGDCFYGTRRVLNLTTAYKF